MNLDSTERQGVSAVSASLEREIKLLAPEEFELPAMADAVPGLTDGTSARMELDATYYDTRDLALARAGVTLRYRAGESGPPWTVKLPERPAGPSLSRLEIRLDGDPDRVPSQASDLVRAYLRTRQLHPVARLRTQRTSVPLLDSDGQQTAELVDDRVTGYQVERQTTVFREIELELTGDHRQRRLQRAAMKRLSAAGCRAEPPQPKLMRTLGERANQPADVTVVPLAADPSLRDLICHALATSVDRLIRHDPGVRLGEDPEDVHQFRVAARTLRSNLKTFGRALDQEWAKALRAELGWLGTAAGTERDLDVLQRRLRRESADLGEDDAAGLAMLFDRIDQQKVEAREATLTALRSRRYDSLLEALVTAAASPRLAADVPTTQPARKFLRRAARSQVKRLDRVVAGVSDPPTTTDLHLIRIQAKRSRYAIEAARPVIGRPAVKHAAALADLQDVLGDFHDSTVAVQWLRAAAADRPSCGLAAGQLIAVENATQARLRDGAHEAWRTADAKKLRRWL